MLSPMVKDIKEELEKGKRYHAASKEEKKILDNKLFRENKPIDNSSKDFIDDITESSGEILKSIKKGISSLPRNFNKKTHKETIKKKQISDMSQEELINEIAETKYKSISPKQLIGGSYAPILTKSAKILSLLFANATFKSSRVSLSAGGILISEQLQASQSG